MLLLGLGSNLASNFGNRFENIDLAISYLQSYEMQLLKKHPLMKKTVFHYHFNIKLHSHGDLD